jgi:hypothetical protein
LVAYQVCDGAPRGRAGTTNRFRPLQSRGPSDHPLRGEPLENWGGVQADETCDGYAASHHDNLLAGAGAVDPVAELRTEGAHSDIHVLSVHTGKLHLYNSPPADGGRDGASPDGDVANYTPTP